MQNKSLICLDNIILDSEWVSPLEEVPKNLAIMMVQNDLVPLGDEYGWQVQIDFIKLKFLKRKYHFPLSFIDPTLKGSVGYAHNCSSNANSD